MRSRKPTRLSFSWPVARKLTLLPTVAILATLLLAFSTAAQAQVRIPAESVIDETAYAQWIDKGSELEQQNQWGEAVAHYEDATREFPRRTDLQRRLRLAKLHYDVGRRYADPSFTTSLERITEFEALNLYSEVLLKISTHYVDEPNWKELANYGATSLDVALTEGAFIRSHLAKVDKNQIEAMRESLYNMTQQTPVRNRQEARQFAINVSRQTAQQLGVPTAAVAMEFVSGAMNSLDRYSSFLTPGQLDDVFSQIEGNFVGLGIELKADDDTLLIVDVISGSPAEQGGLLKDDRIIAVDGHATKQVSTDEAAEMLKGLEGSKVTVRVRRAGSENLDLVLTRRRVEVPSIVDVKIVDTTYGTGYMKLSNFQKTTSRDLDTALWNLHKQGMQRLIIDVRGNPGGLLTASVEVSNRFIQQGGIVSTRGRSSREDHDYQADVRGTWGVPLIVLIDGDTASASEIFAGAIRDNRRGTVIGQRSYGKGSVQGIFPMNSFKSGVRLTTAKFYSPSGQAISNRGVHPDVVVRNVAKPTLTSLGGAEPVKAEDAALQAGIRYAREQLTRRP